MAFLDMSLEELRRYQPAVSKPPDFDVFWADTLAQAERFSLDARFEDDFGRVYARNLKWHVEIS